MVRDLPDVAGAGRAATTHGDSRVLTCRGGFGIAKKPKPAGPDCFPWDVPPPAPLTCGPTGVGSSQAGAAGQEKPSEGLREHHLYI